MGDWIVVAFAIVAVVVIVGMIARNYFLPNQTTKSADGSDSQTK